MLLRAWEPGDASAVFEACQDDEIARWTLVPSPYRREDADAFVVSAAEAWVTGARASFAVVDVETGELLGSCGVKIDGNSGEIGYWVKHGARRSGVATRACRLATEWALSGGGLLDIRLDAAVGNEASQLVAERSGYEREGTVEVEVKGCTVTHHRFRRVWKPAGTAQ